MFRSVCRVIGLFFVNVLALVERHDRRVDGAGCGAARSDLDGLRRARQGGPVGFHELVGAGQAGEGNALEPWSAEVMADLPVAVIEPVDKGKAQPRHGQPNFNGMTFEPTPAIFLS